MRSVRIFEHISLDGVIQAPGGPSEDRGDGFGHGGWVAPFAEPAVHEAVVNTHKAPFDLLLGRRTYDIWSGHFPKVQDNPVADGINAAVKYIATHRPDSLAWGPAESIGTDVVSGVRRIKEMDGPDIIVWGSSTLTPVLLEHGLAEEVLLFVYPVLLGTGKRFFAGKVSPRELTLTRSTAMPSGVLINSYTAGGGLRTGSVTEKRREQAEAVQA